MVAAEGEAWFRIEPVGSPARDENAIRIELRSDDPSENLDIEVQDAAGQRIGLSQRAISNLDFVTIPGGSGCACTMPSGASSASRVTRAGFPSRSRFGRPRP